MTNREWLYDMGYEDRIVFENPDYDSAIIGITTDGQVVYDFDKMVEHLVLTDAMSTEEAIEFIEFNTIRALPYVECPPIIIYSIP